MLYLANPSTKAVRACIADLSLAAIMTPGQGNRLPAAGWYAADNGCGPGKDGVPGKGYPGNDAYLKWLMDLDAAEGGDRYDPDTWRCLFAVSPDVVGDARATLARSERFLPLIRYYTRFPAALVGQDGLEDMAVPWDEFDVFFIGGSTGWKLGEAARGLVAQAIDHGKWVHMGRVNSLKRLRYAEAIGCDSADGTYITFGPDANLPTVLGWVRAIGSQLPLWGAA
jgi:hypothetical protein